MPLKFILQLYIYRLVNSQGLQLSPLPCPLPCLPPSAPEVTPAGHPEGVKPVFPTEFVSAFWASPAPPPPHRKAPFCPSAQQYRNNLIYTGQTH